MKILPVILAIFYCLNTNAQVTRPPYFDTCQYLQPLAGEWMNVNGNDTIKIYLRYHRNFDSDPETFNSTIDELWGWVEYKQGNTVIVSDYANRFVTLPYNLDDLTPGLRSIILSAGVGENKVIPVGYNPCTNPITNLAGFFIDRVRCNTDKYITATVNLQGTQMTWQIDHRPVFWLDSAWCRGYEVARITRTQNSLGLNNNNTFFHRYQDFDS